MPDKLKRSFVQSVMNSFFPPIMILLALVVGAAALWLTPKEEDPQIVVPMADVLVSAPGLSASQVENQITEPLEKLVSQIDGVEYVYSSSMEGAAQVIVRFYVGENREDALVKLYNKLYSNQDKVPPSVTNWLVKPVEIDDVPIVVAAIYSTDPDILDRHQLRRIADQATLGIKSLDATNKVEVIGGEPRKIQIELDSVAMANFKVTIDDLEQAIQLSNSKTQGKNVRVNGQNYTLESGRFLTNAEEVGDLVIAVLNGKPVYLKDVARIYDGEGEATSDTWYRDKNHDEAYPAVFISVAKQKGSNAVNVAQSVRDKLAALQSEQFPPQVQVAVIRDYGETANAKVNNLVSSLGISILTVVVFVGLFLNWRSALVVGIAIPISYGAALGMDLAFGYSINRVTLFALILALGLIVDDPIASIDNIERYLKRKNLTRTNAIVLAMAEIRSALLMSTVAIVIVFTPMFFITGMMGPYMAPLAFNVPISVIFSTVVAFMITPWLAKKLLKGAEENGHYDIQSSPMYRLYRGVLIPLLESRKKAWLFLGLVALLFVLAALLPAFRLVPLKLLPYDNKNEFQLVLNMPESSSFVDTSNALSSFTDYLMTVPEVTSVSGFAGTASPMDFNGMVRHYFMRSEPYQGELRVVLAEKNSRAMQSHELVTRLRADLEQIADKFDADVQLVEVPPGPPVIATITAEVYGDEATSYEDLMIQAEKVADRLRKEQLVSEVDTSIQGDLETWQFIVDQEKAALSVPDNIEVVWSGEGEWKITVDVFRDLGIAYGAALLGVFVVMLIQTGLPAVSGIIMLAIPLTVIGIMPGFWILNVLSSDIGNYPNPALFTATAMIGMIALAGIVVRNSLVLIEFVQQSLAEGRSLHDALIESGVVRMRPILLTAGTTLLGNVVITLDPIFNGLAWAIIFGITASTIFTLLVVPVVYNLAYQNTKGHGLPQMEEEQ